jgi:hypothetical protein
MLERLDAAFAKAGKARGPDFQIIITPPVPMPIEAMVEYAELRVHRLMVKRGRKLPLDPAAVNVRSGVQFARSCHSALGQYRRRGAHLCHYVPVPGCSEAEV